MMLHAFSIYDRDTGYYAVPFFFPHIAVALRAFKQLVNEPGNSIAKTPDAFELRHIGTFNDQNGVLITESPETIATALAALEPSNQLQLIPNDKENAS